MRISLLRVGFPPLSPRPPFHPSGVERGSEQPHLVSALRPRHHWPLPWKFGSKRNTREQATGYCASRRLAEATKSNVAVEPPSLARRAREGLGERVGKLPPPLSPRPPFHPSGVERGSEQPHLVSALRPRHHWPLPWKFGSKRNTREQATGYCASRRLAEATKSNVAVEPPSLARRAREGLGERVGKLQPALSPRPPFHPSGVERGSEQPHLVSSLRLGHHWPLL